MIILRTKIASSEHLKISIVNSKEKGMTSEIPLSKDLIIINMKAHNIHRVSVLKPYLFVCVCLLIELHWNLNLIVSIFFLFLKLGLQIEGAAYLQVRFIQ